MTHPNDIFLLSDNYLKSKYKLNDEQQDGRTDILQNAVTVITGPAGSGKTFCALYTAVELYFHLDLQHKAHCTVKQIVLCTPIPDNDELGFLRGTLDEKMEPRMAGIKKILSGLMSVKDLKDINTRQQLKFFPLSHIRGLTFDDAVVIVDEAQNLTTVQIKLLVGRLGKDSKIVFCGDVSQIDLKGETASGLEFFRKLAENKIDGFASVEFTENNRHPIISKILEYYTYQ